MADDRNGAPRAGRYSLNGIVRWVAVVLVLAIIPVWTIAAAEAGNVDPARIAAQSPGEWLMNGRTFDDWRYSPLKQVDTTSVGNLGLAWEFRGFIVRGRTHRGLESNPVLVDGILYFSGPWGVAYAVDARTGKLLWSYDPQPDGQYARSACCDVVNRGVAVWRGNVYTASLDGYLIALDAKTGKRLWRADTFVDRKWNYTSTGAPAIAGDNIVIGNAGGEFGARGYVSAYDGRTGRLAWRFWVVPGDPAKGPDESPDVTRARRTWDPNTRWELGLGGGPWDAMVYDPELNLLYVGTGNGDPHPRWLRGENQGDDLYLSSIVALDASTGRMNWCYQETPGDSWDYDATAPMVLADIPWQGRTRKVLLQAPKNGIFYVLDRATGQLLRADPFTTVNWTDGVDLRTGRPRITAHADYSQTPKIIWPSGAGGHGWQPMSYSPDTRLVYVPVYDAPMRYQSEKHAQFLPGTLNQAEYGAFPPFNSPGDREELTGQPKPTFETRLKAWDPITGRAVWTSPPLPFISGGTLSTAGDLVFQGSSDGSFSAYEAKTGRLLKRILTGTAIMPAPMTYELDGVQYVAVLAGAGGPQAPMFAPDVAAFTYQNFERLLVFKLGGGPTPLPPPVVPPGRQPLPEAVQASEAILAHGRELFEAQCQRCHVLGGAFGSYPNLWNMAPPTLTAFEAIVLHGAYRYAGMADFSDVLSEGDAAAIKDFIVTDTRARSTKKPEEVAPVVSH
jgi:quinohemoprotein ethanol dehydrogenase